jgi:hypothetical protein
MHSPAQNKWVKPGRQAGLGDDEVSRVKVSVLPHLDPVNFSDCSHIRKGARTRRSEPRPERWTYRLELAGIANLLSRAGKRFWWLLCGQTLIETFECRQCLISFSLAKRSFKFDFHGLPRCGNNPAALWPTAECFSDDNSVESQLSAIPFEHLFRSTPSGVR